MTPRHATATPPASFATQVNYFFHTEFKANTAPAKTLWSTLVHAEPAFGKRFTADSFGATTQLLKLMARLAPQFKRIEGRDASDGKGKGKGSAQPNASLASKGSGKGGGKGHATPSADLKIPACFNDKVGGRRSLTPASFRTGSAALRMWPTAKPRGSRWLFSTPSPSTCLAPC